MNRDWDRQHERERNKYLKDLEDTHFFDVASGIYKPNSCKPLTEAQQQPPNQEPPAPIFGDPPGNGCLTVFLGVFTACVGFIGLVVAACYTFASYGQWDQMIRAAKATEQAATAAKNANDLASKGITQNTLNAQLDQRAWIGLKSVECKGCVIAEDLSIPIHGLVGTIVNTGKTPPFKW